MHRISLLLSALLSAAPAFAQASSTDTQLTQALLNEIRLLRQDLQTTAAAMQRAQIVMFRVQTEAQFLTRATQRADDARNRCNGMQGQRRAIAAEIEQMEARQRNPQNANDQLLESNIARLKGNLENFGAEEQQCQAREIEATAQLKDEQAKMNELQDQLDKLDKALAATGGH